MSELTPMIARFITLFLLALLTTANAYAQARSEDPRKASNLHFGTLYLKPAVNLKELGIDTNVFNEAGSAQKDFTFTVTPQMTTSLPFASRGLLQLFTAADVVYYLKHDSERSMNPNLSLRGEIYFNRLTFFAKPSYLRTRERPSFEIDKRSRRVEQGTLGGAEVQIFPKLALEASAQHLRMTYDADEFFLGTNLSEMLNRDTLTVSGAARWAHTPLTTFVVRADTSQDRFLLSPNRDADGVGMMGGVELKPRALISGNGYVGFRTFTPQDSSVPVFAGVIASAALRYTLLGATTFGVTVNRDVDYSFEPEEPYYLATGWGVELRRQLVGNFDASADFSRYRYAYRMRISTAQPTNADRNDITDMYSGSVGYRVGQDGRLAFGLSYWTRSSNREELRGYEGFRFRSSLTYGL